jgi:hypothetical protein
MNLLDLTPAQLKRAASVKERIEALNKELRIILSGTTNAGVVSTKMQKMSAAVKRKIAASQRARWARLRRAKLAARSAKPAAKKKSFGAATRAKLSAKLKAYWAAKKKAGKK